MSFEETYTRYPFSGLVRLGIVVAVFYRRFLDRREASEEQPREMRPAELSPSHRQAA